MKEIWKDIPEHNGDYQASTLGRIRKFNIKTREYDIVPPHLHPDGYYDITRPKKYGSDTRPYVHRLVALTFCNKLDGCNIVDHINNNHIDNRPENLEWITQKENINRAKALGRVARGKVKCKCVETNEIFESMSAASKYFNIRYYSVYGSCETGKPIKGLHFERVSDDNE